MDQNDEKQQQINKLIAAIRKAKGLDQTKYPEINAEITAAENESGYINGEENLPEENPAENAHNFTSEAKKKIENASELLKKMDINSENYRELLEVISHIEKLNNTEIQTEEEVLPEIKIKSYVTDLEFTGQNPDRAAELRKKLIAAGLLQRDEDMYLLTESQANFAHGKIKKDSPYAVLLCPPDDNQNYWHEETYFHVSAVESRAQDRSGNLPVYNAQTVNNTQTEYSKENKPVVYGKTVVPAFAVIVDGHLQSFEKCIISKYDTSSSTYLLDNGTDQIQVPGETLDTILSPETNINQKQNDAKIKRADGQGIVFSDPEKGIPGTVIPEFALFTQNGLQTYSGCTVSSHNVSDDSYVLSNGNTSITVDGKRFKELTSSVRFSQSFDENTPAYKKLLETQYNDFFRQRDNTACNFRHNLSVYCRKEANSPCDALKVAKEILGKMPTEERNKTQSLMKKMLHAGENINELVIRMYHDAVKEMPLNEAYIKSHNPEKLITRQLYDTVSSPGQKIGNDPSLITGSKDYNLKIGSVLTNVNIPQDKLFGSGKEMIHFESLKVISAAKEGNSVTLMDGKKSYIEMPLDNVLNVYKKQQFAEIKSSKKILRETSMEISY